MLLRFDLVVGIDNLDDHHDPESKHIGLERLTSCANFQLKRMGDVSRLNMVRRFAPSLLLQRGVGAHTHTDWSLALHHRQRGFC